MNVEVRTSLRVVPAQPLTTELLLADLRGFGIHEEFDAVVAIGPQMFFDCPQAREPEPVVGVGLALGSAPGSWLRNATLISDVNATYTGQCLTTIKRFLVSPRHNRA